MEEKELDIMNDEDVKKAVDFAKLAHRGQVRKKDNKTPYVSHALAVMDMLISCMNHEFVNFCKATSVKGAGRKSAEQLKKENPLAYESFYEAYKDVVIAGVLHDVVEDTNMAEPYASKQDKLSREEKMARLRSSFGEDVADLVDVMTEWKEDAYDDRKGTQLKRILDASRGAKLLKCADNIANLGETVADCKAGDLNAWKVYKIKPTEVVENHINTISAIEELEGNPLYSKFEEIMRDAIDLAVECEARLGTKFWDEKADKVKRPIEDGKVEEFFRETYKSNMK